MAKQSDPIQGVLFDFSSTLFRLEKDERWLTSLTDDEGRPLDSQLRAQLLAGMAIPSGENVELNDEYRHAWENRDLDFQLHRKIYLELIRRSGISHPKYRDALYARLPDMSQWTPYPDAKQALETAKNQGLKIAVISNVPFDVRPAFLAHGFDKYVDEFVLSFEVGHIKPNPEIFQLALSRLSLEPRHALMIGDNAHDDGGAVALGCAFELVDPIPTAERPDALVKALRAYQIDDNQP